MYNDVEEEEDEPAKNDDDIKLILLGSSGAGKTSIINKVTRGVFNENEASSTTAAFSIKNIKVCGIKYTLNLWDTLGQERFRQLTKLFYSNSKIIIFVYDITSKESFDDLSYWLKDIEEHTSQVTIKAVIANKMDLSSEKQVSIEEGENFAKSINAKFLEFSAKTESNSKFDLLLIELMSEYLLNKKRKKPNGKIKVTRESFLEKKKKNSCCEM